MSTSDWIQVLMLLASSVAIIVSAIMSKKAIDASMQMVKEQNYIQMFAEYTKRYQDIIVDMPKSVYEKGNDVELDSDILRYMQLYFNLCSEEYDLHVKDSISIDVWNKWLTGMQATMQGQVYRKAWKMEKENYAADFVRFFEKEVLNENVGDAAACFCKNN